VGFIELTVGDARIVFTDREGGVSEPPYDTANLGFLTGDHRSRVQENRRRVGAAVGGAVTEPRRWLRIRQRHGATVIAATRPQEPSTSPPEADAAVTTSAGLPLLVLAADCAPIALVAGDAIAAVHAGWRGLVAGVVEATVAALRAASGRHRVAAVLGPCIHPAHYEFGPDDLDAVAGRLGDTVRARSGRGNPALDLRSAVASALARADVHDLTDVDVCTAASPRHFSHRRDGTTGRQAMFVTRLP
jgi:YfiH family protein